MTHLARHGCGGPHIRQYTPEKVDGFFRHQDLRAMLERKLIQKLQQGTLVASGFASHAPLDAPMVTIPPDRWRSLVPDFEASSAADAGVAIAGIVVREPDPAAAPSTAMSPTAEVRSTTRVEPDLKSARLEIGRMTRRVRFDGIALRLAPLSFELLLILAEAAVAGGSLLSRRQLEARLWSGTVSKKAVAGAIHRLRRELIQQGINKAAVSCLIENRHGVGYRLTVAPADVGITD
jgi:DNA-binding winged helix-turn-helix (wHTH) protein